MTNRHQSLLMRLLELFVAEWGYEQVRRTLSQISEVYSADRNVTALKGPVQRDALTQLKTSRPKRRTAAEYVAKLEHEDRENKTLLKIAERFDRREFLPSMGDVREFLAMQGQKPTDMKDRSEAFGRLLPILQRLPAERLEHLANSDSHSGPATLGPLSDAIRATGDALRRSEKPGEDS